jgi:hypothetical protein
MDKPLYVFEPTRTFLDTWFLGSAIALLALGTLWFLLKNNPNLDKNRRAVLGLILGLIGLVAGFSLAVKLFSYARLQPVEFHSKYVKTPYGKAEFRNIRDFYIKIERKYKPMQPNVMTDSSRYFFILERSDKTHVLSEGDYPIDSILAKMNSTMGYE